MKFVFIPGTLCDERVFEAQINFLSEAGISSHDILVADLTQDDTVAGMAKRLLAKVREPMVILAFSLGAQVAFELVKRSPQQVKKLFLVGAAFRAMTPKFTHALKEALIAASQSFDVYLKKSLSNYLSEGGLKDERTRERLMLMGKSLGKDVCLLQLQAGLSISITEQDLSHIHCPTVIIAGALDRVTTLSAQSTLQAIIPGSSLHVIEGVEHFVTLQAPEKVNEILEQGGFLEI